MSDEQVFGAVAARTGRLHNGAHARTHSLPFAAQRIENKDGAITSRSAPTCSDCVLRDVRRCVSRKLESGSCQNCVRYPLKPPANTVIYGDTPMRIVVARSR